MRNVERRTKRRGNRRDKSTFRILKFFLLWGRVLRSGEVATKFTRDNNNQFGLQTNQFYFPRFTAVVARFSGLHNASNDNITVNEERTNVHLPTWCCIIAMRSARRNHINKLLLLIIKTCGGDQRV